MLFMWRRRTHLPKLSEWGFSRIPDRGSRVWPTGNRSPDWNGKSRKTNRLDPRNNPISTKRDLSHITCFRCKNSGHYFSDCPKGKMRTPGGYIITRKPRDMSEVICFRCDEAGHFARECPKETETCDKYVSATRKIVVVVWTFLLLVRCRIEACNGMQEIVIIWESIKLASLVLIWILWVVTLWRKILTIFEDMRNMVYGRLCILKVVVPREETWPLEKGNDIPRSGFRTK